ncbi:MAG: hypothetical protein JSU86_05450 [Phycisphaerales bacterium]|nr:MAG: hypothetical protein JSU86_05450 [Phycisphaerales bacterium]
MGPIPPVNVGSGGLAGSPALSANRFAGTGPVGTGPGGVGTTSPSPTSDALAVSRVHSAVSELLQSIGGGLEDDKTLRMLIALIILLALLESSQDSAASSRNALASLGAGRMGQPLWVGAYYSSTTITIQQTTTTMFLQTAEGYAPGTNGEPVESPGGQLDVSA